MKNLVLISLVSLSIMSCGNDKTQDPTNATKNENSTTVAQAVTTASEGDKLMEQKCFICHFRTPDPSRRDQMIAPPMMRVQEHYKPVYPSKDEFVKAVMNIVNNPSEENTLMPGAIRKFNVMPKVTYDQKELKMIAEALYEMDFGTSNKPKGGGMKHGGIELNGGKKWKLKANTMTQIEDILTQLNGFESNNISDYNQLGKDVFNSTKSIMTDKSYDGKLFDQIHNFFGGVEENMHQLMAVKTEEEGQAELSQLKNKFSKFTDFFEAND